MAEEHDQAQQTARRDDTVVADTTAREPARAPEGSTTNEAQVSAQKRTKALNVWDRLTNSIRRVTPAVIINNGSRINFGLKAVADSMGILSGLGIVFHPHFKMDPARRSWSRVAANIPTFATLIPGTMYNEKPLTEEQLENYKSMSTGRYIVTKVKEAFNPKDHIVETVALATVINGVLTSVSGFGQSNFRGFNPVSMDSWKKISMEFIMGIFTTVAGASLGLIKERQRAWQISTAAFTWRIPFKATHAWVAWRHGYPEADPPVPSGDKFQMTNFALQQLANVFGFFFAGIKKTEDGDIIRLGKDEHGGRLEEEQIRGYNYDPKKDKKIVQVDRPETKVSQVKDRETALPQHVAAEHARAAVNVTA